MQKLFLVLILTALIFAGSVQAQVQDLPDPGILPNSPFHFIQRFTERVGTFLIFGEVARLRRMFELSERRLAEARALADQGLSEAAEQTLQNYQEYLERAAERAEAARARGFDVDNVLERVAEATLRHQAVLAEVYERVPEQARPAIERAMQAGLAGHEQALRAISGERLEGVLERVEQRRMEVEQKLEGLRREGVPVPAVPLPTREQIRERIRVIPEEVRQRIRIVPEGVEVPIQNQLDFPAEQERRIQESERIREQERIREREQFRVPTPPVEIPGAPGIMPRAPIIIPERGRQ